MNHKAKLDQLERRLAHSRSAALRIYFRDGTSRVTSSGNAIQFFRDGTAIRAEPVRGQNGMLCDLLNGLTDEGSTKP